MMRAPIGVDLGLLARPAGDGPWEDVRMALLDALLAAEAEDDMEHARWQAAFEAAVRSLRLRLLAEGEASVLAAGVHARYPGRRLRQMLPDTQGGDLLWHRLLAAGIPLEECEGLPDTEEARQRRARAMDRAWETLTRVASEEAATWRRRAAAVSAWRRPMLPFYLGGGALLLATLIVAAWLGGQLPAPAWFAPINHWWWGLPWP